MKSSIQFILPVLMGLAVFQSHAQTYHIKGGLNLSSMLDKDNDSKPSSGYQLKPGFHLGVLMENSLTRAMSLEFGLLLSQKGYAEKEEFDDGYIRYRSNLVYLDFPVYIKGYHSLNDNMKLFGVIGPYLGVGFGGINTIETSFSGNSGTTKMGIRWGERDTSSDYTNPDFGLSFGLGVQKDVFLAAIYYDLGLANISPVSYNGALIQNRVFKFSFGYRLGR